MPEAAECKLNVDFLKKYEQSTIVDITINSGQFLKREPKNFQKIIQEIQSKKTTYYLNEITSRGKLIYGFLSTIYSKQPFISSLGMSGFWTDQDLKHNHLTIHFKNENKIHYNDARRFGQFNFINNEELNNKIYDLGIDFFNNVKDQYHLKKIQDRIDHLNPEKQICEVLLDQSIFCGVGNYIKSEVLFKTLIHPAEKIKNISKDKRLSLIENCQLIILEAYKQGGASFKTFKDDKGVKSGTYQNEFNVYGKKSYLNYKVEKDTFNDGRSTFFIPELQKLIN